MWDYYDDDEPDYVGGGMVIVGIAIFVAIVCIIFYGAIAVFILISPIIIINSFAKAVILFLGFYTYGSGIIRVKQYIKNAKFDADRMTFLVSLLYFLICIVCSCLFIGCAKGMIEFVKAMKVNYPYLMEEYQEVTSLTKIELFFKTSWNSIRYSFRYVMDDCLDMIFNPINKFIAIYTYFTRRFLGKLLSFKAWDTILHLLASTVLYFIVANVFYFFLIPIYLFEKGIIYLFQKRRKLFRTLILILLICGIFIAYKYFDLSPILKQYLDGLGIFRG